jgi:dihydroflavonol-4-reductase
MTGPIPSSHMQSALVTGGTGLLGNTLVRALVARGVHVKALARSPEKALQQFGSLPVEIVTGDMADVAAFAPALQGVDLLFHTAAYFREAYAGAAGDHAGIMQRINVEGTATLLEHAYAAGIRRVVHTSSTIVLFGPRGTIIDETMRREERDANEYGVSKIRSDRVIDRFLAAHPDMAISMVLPGWMVGPGDIGPTAGGQFVLDFVRRKIPGIPPATLAVVDTRDVAEVMIAAALNGRRGERYLAAGPQLSMKEIAASLERVSGIKAPTRQLSTGLLFAVAAANQLWSRVSGQPALINLETARFIARERDRTRYDLSKTTRELGVTFRPADDTFRDTLTWYQEHGWLDDAPALDKMAFARR